MKIARVFLTALILMIALTGCGEKAGKVELSTQTITLTTKGMEHKLTARVYDTNENIISDYNQGINWTIADPQVATVDANGKVKAVGSGITKVTASVGELMASTTVKVQIIQSLSIVPKIKSLKVGEKFQFKAVVLDEKGNELNLPVAWDIPNKSVAMVNQAGIVLAKGEGNVLLKAKVKNKGGQATITVIDTEKDKDSKAAGLKVDGEKKKKTATGLKIKKKKK